MGFKNFINNLFSKKEEGDCMKVLDMLDSILDDEASDKEKKDFHQHVESCMWCYEKFTSNHNGLLSISHNAL